MCGIAGWIDWQRDLTKEEPVLRAMGDTLKRRGPDAEGIWLSEHAAFAHRRLIVIDPAGGTQPMVRQRGDRKYVITYNGELYNTQEVRDELESRGHVFLSRSDTEVLLLSYIEWGPECVNHLNGIFAFGVWDEAEQRLFLARDRLGVKPLYFAQIEGGTFLFASELKALLAHPLVPAEIDSEGLAELFLIGPAHTPGHGVFRRISELRPGHWLLYDRRGNIQIHRYWALYSRPHTDDFPTTVARVRELFVDSVERQLVSDVPVCTLLSGGLDSSAITAVAAQVFARDGKGPLHTYSVDYVGNDVNFRPNDFQPDSDAPWAARVSEHFGTEHHRVLLDTQALVEALADAVSARDLPGMTDVDSSLYLFSREIKKTATVVLSGECADEVFGGYPWFRRQDALAADTFPWSLKLEERIRVLSPELVKSIKPKEYVAERYRRALAEVPQLPGEPKPEARIREISYLTLTTWMLSLLDRKDRMSMAAGLEIRVPFCDHRLVEYVWNIPWEMKFHGQREKGLLRTALAGILPDDVLWRPKSPYPKTYDPKYLTATRMLLEQVLADHTSPLLPLVDTAYIRKALKEQRRFDIPWFGQLMRLPQFFAYLVQVNLWLRKYRITVR